MANISLTTACNRDCACCFARAERRSAVSHMTVETFVRALDFLERSGIHEARLLGGEPTLHPLFVELAEMALARGLRVLVFSNGLMPEPVLRRLESAPPERVAVLLNVSERDPGQAAALRRLGPRVTLGFNIHAPAFDVAFLLEWICGFGLSPGLRFGLAHPAVRESNVWLHPRQYSAVGERLARFAREAAGAGVRISFDCGFVPCMFPGGDLKAVDPASDAGMRCSPVLDLLPDGRIISCYPLADVACAPLPEQETADTVRRRFAAKLEPYRRLGVYRECAGCAWRESGRCAGGCLAAALQRLRRRAALSSGTP